MRTEDLEAQRKRVVAYLAQPGGEDLVALLRRRWGSGSSSNQNADQMAYRLGAIDCIGDIEALREQAKEE